MALPPFDSTRMGKFANDDDEVAFQQWYSNHAKRLNMSPSPDAYPNYDFRNAYLEGYEPDDNGFWDYRASAEFAKTASKGDRATRENVRFGGEGGRLSAPEAKVAPAVDVAPIAIAELSEAQRADALERVQKLEKRLDDIRDARKAYVSGILGPEEVAGYRQTSRTPAEFAQQLADHGRAFERGRVMSEQTQALLGTSWLPAFAQTFVKGLGEFGLGALKTGAMVAAGGGASPMYSPLLAEPTAEMFVSPIREKFLTDFLGLPANKIERAGFESAYPWLAAEAGSVSAWVAVNVATSGLGRAAGIPKWLEAARGAKGLVALNTAGFVGGALVAAGTAPESATGRDILHGGMVGLGGTALVSSFLAGRPIGTSARLLRLQAMAESFEAAGLGGAMKVAPRLTFGRLAMSALDGAAYTTLTEIGRGTPIDQSIGAGVDSALEFVAYDTAFIGLGRMARWLPTHVRVSEEWAKTAAALKIPSRMAAATGDVGNALVQGGPLAAIGGLVGGPIGAALGGTVSAAKALELQRELAITASRLHSIGAISEETINKILTGQWTKLSAEEAETVTRALTKDVIERATAGASDEVADVMNAAISESLGPESILGANTPELRALAFERAALTQQLVKLRGAGILEVDPQIVQLSMQLARNAERRAQLLLEEANSGGIRNRVLLRADDSQINEIIASVETVAATTPTEAGRLAANRLIETARTAVGEARLQTVNAALRRGSTEAPLAGVVTNKNSTYLHDLIDAQLESAGIDASLSPEGQKFLDKLVETQRLLTGEVAGSRKALPGGVGLPGGGEMRVAPAGARNVKAPLTLESSPLAGALLGGAAVASSDDDDNMTNKAAAVLLGAGAAYAGYKLLSRAGARRAMVAAPAAVERIAARGESAAAARAEERAFATGREVGPVPRSIPVSSAPSLIPEAVAAEEAAAARAAHVTYTPAGILKRKDKPPIRYFTLNVDLPEGAGKAGSRVSEDILRKYGFNPPGGEEGFVKPGLVGTLGAGALGAVLAPAIARRLGFLDDEDSVLTASALGFLTASALGFKMLSRDGLALTESAARVARFVKPTVEGSLSAEAASRVVGKPTGEFKAVINGQQVSGRRLYWLLPHAQQIEHTVATIDRAPSRTTVRTPGGRTKPLDLPERRKAFERDLVRFAPFSATEPEFTRITEHFFAATKALGYTPEQAMKVYKGLLGWMTTPLENRARADFGRVSLKELGVDAKNPFSSAAGLEELRTRATTAEVITGPSQPLPSNYRRSTVSQNKDGVPAAGRVRSVLDDIEANRPSVADGTTGTLRPWWSFQGARGVAPTVRFLRYAERISAGGDPVGQLIHNVSSAIFTATSYVTRDDDKDRGIINGIFRSIRTPEEMKLVRDAVEDPAILEKVAGTNARVHQAAIGVRKFLKDKADALGLPEFARIEDYFPWVYNYRTRRELAELAKRGLVPSDVNFPIDHPVPRHVYFNHLEARTANAPLGEFVSPVESLLLYAHGANRKLYMDQLLANFGPETFQRIRATQPWIAHDLGRWLLDVVGVPGPGTLYAQHLVESAGLWLEKFPLFQRSQFAQEVLDRYFLSSAGANNLSRLATGWAYTSKISWNALSAITNMSQMIINGGTEYGLLNVLSGAVIGGPVAVGERVPALAPLLDAITPLSRQYRKLLGEAGILSENSQRHFDALALYEANFGTNRAHMSIVASMEGAVAGAAGAAYINRDRQEGDKLSIAGSAATVAGLAGIGAAKSAILRRALLRVHDVGTFPFQVIETWNRSAIGIAGLREAQGAMAAAKDPLKAGTRRMAEVIDGAIVGAIGGGAVGYISGDQPSDVASGALLGATIAGAGGAAFGESRTTRTQRTLERIRNQDVVFESRIFKDQAKDALKPYTDEEVAQLYAQMQTDITQFRIAKEGRGYYLNTPHGQVLGALQSYTLNQAEFVGGRFQSMFDSLRRRAAGEPAKIDFRVLRYGAFVLGVGSVYGALLGGARDPDNDPDYWISRIGFGVVPFLRWNDLARRWEVMAPTDMFKGPIVGDMTRTANTFLTIMTNDDASATFADQADKLALALFPGARNIAAEKDAANGKAYLRLMQEGNQEAITGPQLGPGR